MDYTILVKNIGTGATGTPVTVEEYLPAGFTYDATFTPVVTVNGATDRHDDGQRDRTRARRSSPCRPPSTATAS